MGMYQQCIFFILDENGQGSTDPPSASSSETSCSSKAFILLPETYLREHPDVRRILSQNNILVLNEGNVSRCISAEDESLKLDITEIFLNDPPGPGNPFFIPCHAQRVISALRYSSPGVNVIRSDRDIGDVRPATDDENVSVIKYMSKHIQRTPVAFISDFEGYGLDERGSFLHLAAYRGNLSLASRLLELGLDINSICKNTSFSPLLFALHSRSTAIVQLLVKHGADVNCLYRCFKVTRGPATPLHFCYDYEVAECLLQNGADPNAGCEQTRFRTFFSPFNTIGTLKAILNYGAHVYPSIDLSISSLVDDWVRGQLLRKDVFMYMLERCYINFNFLKRSCDVEQIIFLASRFSCTSYFRDLFDTLIRHGFKIAAKDDRISDDFCHRLSEIYSSWNVDYIHLFNFNQDFPKECLAELAQLRCERLGDTEVSYFELLSKNEHEIACLLRSKCVSDIVDSDELTTQFPLYGSILRILLEKGKLRNFIQAKSIRNLDIVSSHFRELPDELKEYIVSYFGMLDVTHLEKANVRPQGGAELGTGGSTSK